MCYRPIHIKSASQFFAAVDVPCGHCSECLESRRTDITIRAYYEYLECKDNLLNGISCPVIFTTLTYSNEYLPIVEVGAPVYDDNGILVEKPRYISCWNKDDIQKFLKNLRRKLEYHYDIPRSAFTYLITCERGHDNVYKSEAGFYRRGTARPHYHIIFFLHSHNISESLFFRLVSECWTYGNVDNLLVQDSRTPHKAIEYVCKYVTKDDTETLYSASYPLNRLFRGVDSNQKPLLTERLFPSKSSHEIELICQPFNSMSKNFGKYFWHEVLADCVDSVPCEYKTIFYRNGKEFTRTYFYYELSVFDETTAIDKILGKSVTLPSSSTIVRNVNVPSYYFRKLTDTPSQFRRSNYIPQAGKHGGSGLVFNEDLATESIFVDGTIVEFQYLKSDIHSHFVKTDFGRNLDFFRRIAREERLHDKIVHIASNWEDFSRWNKDVNFGSQYDIDTFREYVILDSDSRNTFVDYIVHHLNISRDIKDIEEEFNKREFFGSPLDDSQKAEYIFGVALPVLYNSLYELMCAYFVYLRKIERTKQEVQYLCNKDKALRANPSLFGYK